MGKTRQMKFNIDKCMVLSVTLKRKPLSTDYYLHNQKLLLFLRLNTWELLWTPSYPLMPDHVDATCKFSRVFLEKKSLKKSEVLQLKG